MPLVDLQSNPNRPNLRLTGPLKLKHSVHCSASALCNEKVTVNALTSSSVRLQASLHFLSHFLSHFWIKINTDRRQVLMYTMLIIYRVCILSTWYTSKLVYDPC